VGAVGVMQIMPATGEGLGVGDIHQLEPNIHGGVKYIRLMIDEHFANDSVTLLNQTLLALAAYNAGPGRVKRLRAEAAKQGLDPNIWRNNVELIAARRIGEETVNYVANIYRYYVAYRLAEVEEEARKEERERVRGGQVPATPR
jgi:membrane-bound lytic murein transglycosylase MltF